MRRPEHAEALTEAQRAELAGAQTQQRKRWDAPRHSHALAPDSVIRDKVKAELRGRMRALRTQAKGEASAARSARIVERLQQLPVVCSALRIGLFWPMTARNEVDLRAFATWLHERGVEVGLPCVRADHPDMLFRCLDPGAVLEPAGGTGPQQPPESARLLEQFGVMIVPALLVDARGHRIGYGAGYYDRYLASLPSTTTTIAVAYDYQLVAEVPNQPWDIAVSTIVTDVRVLTAE
jgi:5-formyltetrahydrofolate cyclo-ligase